MDGLFAPCFFALSEAKSPCVGSHTIHRAAGIMGPSEPPVSKSLQVDRYRRSDPAMQAQDG